MEHEPDASTVRAVLCVGAFRRKVPEMSASLSAADLELPTEVARALELLADRRSPGRRRGGGPGRRRPMFRRDAST